MASVYFEVHGDFITELARERYKETKDVNVGVAFFAWLYQFDARGNSGNDSDG